MKNSTSLMLGLTLLFCGTALAKSPKRQIICCPPPVACCRPYTSSPDYCAQFPIADDGMGNYYFYIDYYVAGSTSCQDGPYPVFGWYPDTTPSPEICENGACEPLAPYFVDQRTTNNYRLRAKIGRDADITDDVVPRDAWEGKNKTGHNWTPRTGAKTMSTKWVKVVTTTTTPATIWVKVLTIELNLKDAQVSPQKHQKKVVRTAVVAIEADAMPTNPAEQAAAPTIQGRDLKIDSTNKYKGEITLPEGKRPIAVITNTPLKN